MASDGVQLDGEAEWEHNILQGMFPEQDALMDDADIEEQRAWMEVNWLVSQLHKQPVLACRRLRTCACGCV